MPDGRPQVSDSAIVEKIMSISLEEFHRGIKRLANDIETGAGQRHFQVPAGATSVIIAAEPLESAVLGANLRLERYRIRLDLSALAPVQRRAFVERFDRIFQRGGG